MAKTPCSQCKGAQVRSLLKELDPACHNEYLVQLKKYFFQKDWPLLFQTRVELKIGDS